MNDSRKMSMQQLEAFIRSSDGISFAGQSREKTYAWIERTLRNYDYLKCSRKDKGILRCYLEKMTGYSPAQLTRLIAQFRCQRQVRIRPYQRHRFPSKFTREDQVLLAGSSPRSLVRTGHGRHPQTRV